MLFYISVMSGGYFIEAVANVFEWWLSQPLLRVSTHISCMFNYVHETTHLKHIDVCIYWCMYVCTGVCIVLLCLWRI